jgi:hypothetical protein
LSYRFFFWYILPLAMLLYTVPASLGLLCALAISMVGEGPLLVGASIEQRRRPVAAQWCVICLFLLSNIQLCSFLEHLCSICHNFLPEKKSPFILEPAICPTSTVPILIVDCNALN